MRPVLDPDACHHCIWVCTTFCPDGAISAGPDGTPRFDLDHCKGCLVCVAVCAPHAIRAVPEARAAAGAAGGPA
jgi:pyruvate ferredoxin oxidoreductase gamma subunit